MTNVVVEERPKGLPKGTERARTDIAHPDRTENETEKLSPIGSWVGSEVMAAVMKAPVLLGALKCVHAIWCTAAFAATIAFVRAE